MTHNKTVGCVYVMWHRHYNEEMATIFLIHLRAAGLCAKLVGLHGDRHVGRFGVTLVADVSLGDALHSRDQILGIIAPCTPGLFDRTAEPDARIAELLARAQQQAAVFVAEDDHTPPPPPWPTSALAVSPETVSVLAASLALVDYFQSATVPHRA